MKLFKTVLVILVLFVSCNGSKPPRDTSSHTVTKEKNIVGTNLSALDDKSINCIFQDVKGNYWFSTNGYGVCRYQEDLLTWFTQEDGLCSDYIGSIQQDESGDMWFSSAEYKITRFDGNIFDCYNLGEGLPTVLGNWEIEPDQLWFEAGSGAFLFDGTLFGYLPLRNTASDSEYEVGSPVELGPYGVYCILKDRSKNIWFGTQSMGVCRYDGSSFTWFTEQGLGGPAVRGLFEDSKGNFWFGNNGGGLFRLDTENRLSNFTREHGLSNDEFLKSNKQGPGTLARVWTINEDNFGDIWIGTADAGVWRYDGKNLTNYTTSDGLSSNAINTIFKDQDGTLWFGTDGNGVCVYDGTSFKSFAP